MKRATIDDMEIGNLLFGNSRGLYSVEPRRDYQDAFCGFLEENGFDCDGYHYPDGNPYENDIFVIRPYYWGEDGEICALPNFVFKPLGLEIQWYKYPMRDAYSNMDVPVDVFKAILMVCAFSMNKPKEG